MGMDYQEVMLMKEQALNKQRQDAIREQSYRQKAIDEQVERNAIWNKLASLNEDDGSFLDFKKKVTDSFVVEGLTVFVDNCINPAIIREETNQRLVRQMVSEFVKEEGSTNLLNRMKRTSYVMSELAYVTEQTIQSVLEAVDKNNTETFKIDDKVKNDYYDKLGKLDVDDAVNKIKENVLKQTEEFKTENMKTKLELASTADKTKQKVEKVENALQDKANSEKAKQEAEKLTEAYCWFFTLKLFVPSPTYMVSAVLESFMLLVTSAGVGVGVDVGVGVAVAFGVEVAFGAVVAFGAAVAFASSVGVGVFSTELSFTVTLQLRFSTFPSASVTFTCTVAVPTPTAVTV